MAMNPVELNSWQEFLSRIDGVLQDARDKRSSAEMYVSEPLFRGHYDASWRLATTLERYVNRAYTARDYHHILLEYLDMVNINAYSLFEGEDALMETLAYREIERHPR
jgi:hypothetical protein